jgi:hypothetical protein
MTALGIIATVIFWTGCCGMLFGAYLALTGETVIDKGRWGETEQVDHRSRSSQGFALHDEGGQ